MVTIQNGRGIGTVQNRQDPRIAGQPLGKGYDRPYENPFLPQITTLTLAEQADVSDEIVAGQVWTTTLTDPQGVVFTSLYTVTAADDTAGTDGAGLAYMAGVLAAALEADASLSNIIGATSTGAVQTLTFLHPDQGVWTITQVCTPDVAETVLLSTPATAQAAGGVRLPMARFVAATPPEPNGLSRASLPTSAADLIAGVALRDITYDRPFDTDPLAVDEYPIGAEVSVREEGDVAMSNVGDTAAVALGPVHAVISVTGGDQLGEARSDRDGVADVWTATPTALNDAAYELTVSIADVDGLGPITGIFPFTADGTATAAEVCDGIRAAMALDLAFAARVVASGTTTLVLTGQELGVAMTVVDTQDQGAAVVGAWASITNTTPAVAYTTLVPRARWSRPVAAGALGVLTATR